ncbi:MAG: ribosome small subunit-dependent GTPase A [Phascolarctobacterium sp.]|nr:ribosome small subunit-dependent GTPase A [Phascolarctobacterium sp.]
MTILQGRVLKNYNGYYYVNVPEENKTYTCKVKGKMKKSRFSLATGDFVDFELGEKDEGMILKVLPRKNYLLRPIMANLDLFVATFACASPDFSPIIADKLIALAESADIPIIIVFNKLDLAPAGFLANMQETYGKIGYEIYPICAQNGKGVADLRERLRGKVCAFGGPSGVGKSSTINAIDPQVALRTGDVSEKIGRGKHTTRFAELLPFDEGYIADTPGFGNLLLEGFAEENVLAGFKEFLQYAASCRFHPCTHTHEPGCAVKEAVELGELARSRHASYQEMLEEVKFLNKKAY